MMQRVAGFPFVAAAATRSVTAASVAGRNRAEAAGTEGPTSPTASLRA